MHAIWMNSENYTLDRKSQIQRTADIIGYHVYEMFNTGKSIEIESEHWLTEVGRGQV